MTPKTILLHLLGILILAGANVSALTEDVAQTTTAAVTETEAPEQDQPTTLPVETGATCVCNCENVDRSEVQCGTGAESTQTPTTEVTFSTSAEDEGSTDLGPSNTTDDPASKPQGTMNDAADSSADTTTPTSSSPLETSSTQQSTDPPCLVEGLQPHETDCRAYNECGTSGSDGGGSLRLATKFCADNEAFSAEFGRCSRDISNCDTAVACLSKGTVADPLSNSSYYICEPRLASGQIMVFHVKCGDNEVFYPELGKCFLDFLNPAQPPLSGFPPYNWNVVRDIDLVKAELKLIKEHDKLKLKQEKERVKAEKKLQKEREKEAKRLAKEQEKLVDEQVKQESAQFVCVQAGNFASSISDTVYFSCAVKKTKYKLTVQKCPLGSKFDAEQAVCKSATSPVVVAVLPESDDDDDVSADED